MAQVNDRLFSADPERQSWETFHYDPASDTFVIHEQQDVQELVDVNKARFNSFDERSRWQEDWNLVASIPLNVYFDLEKRGITRDPKALHKWLNDPDNRAFRTRPGRL